MEKTHQKGFTGWVKESVALIKPNLAVLIIFEFFYTIFGHGAVFGAGNWLMNRVMQSAGFTFVEGGNLLNILTNPLCLATGILIAVVYAFYTVIEFTALISTYQASRVGQTITLWGLTKTSVKNAASAFIPRNWLFFPYMFILLPLFSFGGMSNFIDSYSIPEFIADFIIEKPVLLALVIAASIALFVLIVFLTFLPHFFTLEEHAFMPSSKKSIALVRGKFIKTFGYFAGSAAISYILTTLLLLPVVFLASFVTGLPAVKTLFNTIVNTDLLILLGNPETAAATTTIIIVSALISIIALFISIINAPVLFAMLTSAFYRLCDEKGVDVTDDIPESLRVNPDAPARKGIKIAALCICLLCFLGYRGYTLGEKLLRGGFGNFGRIQVAAHRGASKTAPDNTRAAFQKAIDIGADYVELDVVETKDGVLIISHDLDLSRKCGIDRQIGEMNYDELKNLDIGSHFSPEFSGERFMTLDEAIDMCDGKIKMNIELKPAPTDHQFVEKAVEIFQKHNFYDKGFFASLDLDTLKKVEQIDPRINTCLDTFVAAGEIELCEVDIYSVEATFLTEKLLDRIHSSDKTCWVWTVNDESNMDTVMDQPIEGIVTDDPSKALGVSKEKNVSRGEYMQTVLFNAMSEIM